MSQSAMSGVGSATTRSGTGVGGDDGERLRRAVLSGPGATVVADDAWLTGVLGLLVSADVVAAALAGHVDVRRRVLTGVVTVVAIFGLCLFVPAGQLRRGAGPCHRGAAWGAGPGRSATDRAGAVTGSGQAGG